jgi:hypothetical protein
MSAPATRFSYSECYEAWEKAKESPKGIRVQFATIEEATTFRQRLHKARSIDRTDNTIIYGQDDPLYGRSVYDPYMVRIRQDTEDFYWVYIIPVSIEMLKIESLDEIEDRP